jgi:hypothetical protein
MLYRIDLFFAVVEVRGVVVTEKWNDGWQRISNTFGDCSLAEMRGAKILAFCRAV